MMRASHSGLGGELRITTTPGSFGERGGSHSGTGARLVAPSQSYSAYVTHHHAIGTRRLMWRFRRSRRFRQRRADIPRTILPVAAPYWLALHPCRRQVVGRAEWIIHERLPTPLRWTVTNNHGKHSRTEISKTGKISVSTARAR